MSSMISFATLLASYTSNGPILKLCPAKQWLWILTERAKPQ